MKVYKKSNNHFFQISFWSIVSIYVFPMLFYHFLNVIFTLAFQDILSVPIRKNNGKNEGIDEQYVIDGQCNTQYNMVLSNFLQIQYKYKYNMVLSNFLQIFKILSQAVTKMPVVQN